MKLSNKVKDYIVVVGIMLLVVWLLSGALLWVSSLFAEETGLTDVEEMNRHYAEETIKSEMRFNAMKEYMDNLSVDEYIKIFFEKEV